MTDLVTGFAATDLVVCFSLLAGTFFMLVSSVGLIRLPDVYGRLHAVTKATTLGMAGLLIGSMIAFADAAVTEEVLALLFVFLTNPVGGHMIGRSAYYSGVPMTDLSVMDDLERVDEQPRVEHETE